MAPEFPSETDTIRTKILRSKPVQVNSEISLTIFPGMENNNQQPTPPPPPHSYSSAPFHHLLQQQHQQLQMFWTYQRQEIEHANDFKNHQLPLARIKNIMKADEDVRMISAETPIIFAKACELFILELTIRAWLNAEENKRRTLQKNDIAAAISRTDIFDFLVDIVPREDIKEEGAARIGLMPGGMAAAGVPYYHHPPTGAGEMMGQLAMDPAMYMQQPWQPMWQQGMLGEGSGSVAYAGQEYAAHPPPQPPQPPPPPPPPGS